MIRQLQRDRKEEKRNSQIELAKHFLLNRENNNSIDAEKRKRKNEREKKAMKRAMDLFRAFLQRCKSQIERER